MAAGTGRKEEEGFGVVMCLGDISVRLARFSSCSASTIKVAAVTPFLATTSSWSVVGGCFLVASMGPVATTEAAAAAFPARVVECWKSSSEHERAGVLQKAEQTKTHCSLFSLLHHQKLLLL